MTRRIRRLLVPALLVVSAVGIATMLAVPEERSLDDLTPEEIARIDNFVERFTIGQRLLGSGRDEKAEQVFRDLIAEEPKAAAVHHALGLLLQFRGRPDEATEFLLHAAQLAPKDVAIQRDAGLDLLRKRLPADAEPYLGRARKLWPEDVEILVAHATSLRALGKADRARAAYREALAVQPESVDAGVGLAAAIVDTQPGEAARLVAKLPHSFADVSLVHGLAMMGLDKPDEAVVHLTNSARRSPANVGGLAVLGQATRSLAELGAAEPLAQSAALWCERTGTPPALEPSILFAEALAALGRPGDALHAMEQASVVGADAATVRRGRLATGSLLARMGRPDDARTVLSILADDDFESPDRELARFALGTVELDALRESLGTSQERKNDLAWAQAVRAWLGGDDAGAAHHAQRARELSDPVGEFPALLLR